MRTTVKVVRLRRMCGGTGHRDGTAGGWRRTTVTVFWQSLEMAAVGREGAYDGDNCRIRRVFRRPCCLEL
jgi:hypothetical protein